MKTELEDFKMFCEGYIGGKIGDPIQRNQLFNESSLKEQFEQLKKAVRCNYRRHATTVKCPTCKNNMILYKSMEWRCVKYECYYKITPKLTVNVITDKGNN
jgi:acetyl-CoA carboxylase beta subunit